MTRRWDETDWVAAWFPIIERHHEDVHVAFGRLRAGNPQVEWVRLHHHDYDGIGGLGHLLREAGMHLPELPEGREGKRPGFWTRLRAILFYLRMSKHRSVEWVRHTPKRMGASAGVAWHLFTAEESAALEAAARGRGVSLNTLLLHALDGSVAPLWIKSGAHARLWLVPFNMRGPVRGARDTANHASYLCVEIPPRATPQTLHERMRCLLKNRTEWGAWWGIQLGRWIGLKGMQKIVDSYHDKEHFWTGTFSNLGAWPPAGASNTPEDEGWFLCPPCTRAHPIATGCVIWKGRIGLALQLHPGLSTDLADAERSIQAWVTRLRELSRAESQLARAQDT